jgi:hypothetical protein
MGWVDCWAGFFLKKPWVVVARAVFFGGGLFALAGLGGICFADPFFCCSFFVPYRKLTLESLLPSPTTFSA